MLEEIYLLYVSKTYHMNFWVCLGTFVFVGSGHVGVSMFIIVIKLIIWLLLWQIYEIWNFLWKIIHIEPLTNTINTILWCIWVYLRKKPHPYWNTVKGRQTASTHRKTSVAWQWLGYFLVLFSSAPKSLCA